MMLTARTGWIAVLGTVLCVCQVVSGAEDLLQNGGFEAGVKNGFPEGWLRGAHYGKPAGDECFAVVDEPCQAGAHSLKLTTDRDDLPVIIETDLMDVAAQERLLFSVYLRAPAGTAGTFTKIYILSADYKHVFSRVVMLRDEWVHYGVVLPAQPTAGRFRARVDLREAGTVWVDSASLVRIGPDTDLSSLPGIGYRERQGPGGVDVTLTLGPATGKSLPNINGVCFCHGFGAKTIDSRFQEAGLKVIRNHNVLTNFRILQKDETGKLHYRWEALDASIRAILACGAIPEMSLCFVPLQLVDNPDPTKIRRSYDGFYLGPPSDMAQWREYIQAVVKHCQETFDTKGWIWIVGNEPSLKQFSMGTEDEYYELYQQTVAAATAVDPGIVIGAGSFANLSWLKRFIQRCGQDKTRVDILTWHHYDLLPEQYEAMIGKVRGWTAPFPQLASVPLAIDEWNPTLPDHEPPAYSAGHYAAALQAATIHYMQRAGLAYHTFFIAHGGPSGVIGGKGVKNPTFNVFQMLSMMGREELALAVPEEEPYVGGFATRDEVGTTSVLLWYSKHRYDQQNWFRKQVHVEVGDTVDRSDVTVFLIDEDMSNGLAHPEKPELQTTDTYIVKGGTLSLEMRPNSVALIVLRPRG